MDAQHLPCLPMKASRAITFPLRCTFAVPCMVASLFAVTSIGTATANESHVLDPGWPAIAPADMPERSQISGVAIDGAGNVLALGRGENHWMPATFFKKQKIRKPVVLAIDARDGTLTKGWGAGLFMMPHQIVMGPLGSVWVVDAGLHRVFRFDADGKQLPSVGGNAIRFNMPTDVAFLSDGSFVVADGYVNSRIVKFDARGKPLAAWGTNGAGPLQFNTPHSVAVDEQDRIYVADRENNRLQVLSSNGEFLAAWQGVDRPITVRVAASRVFVLSNLEADKGIVRSFNLDGHLVESFHTKPQDATGDFEWPHGLAVSGDGADVYVGFTLTGRRVQRYRRVARTE